MADRTNHYDAAFEAYLRRRRVPYVAVDEARRALAADDSIKSLDFIVYSQRGPNLLVDVKGRRFPSGSRGERGVGRRWENWSTADEVRSLQRWKDVFGDGFRVVLVFAYNVLLERLARCFPDEALFVFRDRSYAFLGVPLEEYREHMRRRSPRWDTVDVPRTRFREMFRPVPDYL